MTKSKALKRVLFICFIIILLDEASKWWVQEYLPQIKWNIYLYPYGGIGIFKNILGVNFSIVHETNTGAAWGVFSDFQTPLLFIRIGLIIALFIYIVFINRSEQMLIPFALIIAGAIGNVMDHFIYGHVIDMFYFKFGSYSYPIFNVADISIFFGVLWLCLLSLLRGR
ncbi:MAG: signal peptidase II [Chlamydiales bacterium]|nr:signal peptidase II [Chlamydiales bacterium]